MEMEPTAREAVIFLNTQMMIVLVLNFIISLIGTLAYSVRLVGVRTGKIALSFALFNVLTLISRVAVTFQAPLLTKHVAKNAGSEELSRVFFILIMISGIATIAGAFLIPTFQRMLSKGVEAFSVQRSMPKLLLHSFSKAGINHIKSSVSIPVTMNITKLDFRRMPKKTIVLNVLTVALITSGAFSPIYAGSIEPDLSATCLSLSPIINGIATVIMSIFIDPKLSIMTDDVIEGKCSMEEFRTCVIGMVGSKTVGTFLALPLFLPASYVIAFVARFIPA